MFLKISIHQSKKISFFYHIGGKSIINYFFFTFQYYIKDYYIIYLGFYKNLSEKLYLL